MEKFNCVFKTKKITRKTALVVFIMMMIFQVVVYVRLTDVYNNNEKLNKSFKEVEAEFAREYVDNVVRKEMRLQGSSIRQSWTAYIEANPNTKLLYVNEEGFVYYENDKNEGVYVNEETMRVERTAGERYRIVQRDTGETLLSNSLPRWNIEELIEILNVVAVPHKNFGGNGGFILVDSVSGDILIDSFANKDRFYANEDDLYFKGAKNLSTIHLKANNQNREFVRETMFRAMRTTNTSASDKLVNLFNEGSTFEGNPGDFKKYPLGEYNRDFVEIVHIPDESLGVNGTNMQVKMLITANERDIIAGFTRTQEKFDALSEDSFYLSNLAVLYSILSVVISMSTIVFSVFVIRILTVEKEKAQKECYARRRQTEE